MSDTYKDPLLLEHESDGIRELDNKLPRWWVWLFNLTIGFSVVYVLYYHVYLDGKASATEYLAEMRIGDQIKQASLARFEAEMEGLQPSQDPAVIASGKATFKTLCAPCHREDGGGLVGPNLTDDYWVHGPLFKDNLRIIYNGVPDKGMVTWKGVMKAKEIFGVASYIYTLRGTQPPNPKPREDLAPTQTGPNIFE